MEFVARTEAFKQAELRARVEAELIERTGNKTVPCLLVESEPMKESEAIRKYLVSRFL